MNPLYRLYSQVLLAALFFSILASCSQPDPIATPAGKPALISPTSSSPTTTASITPEQPQVATATGESQLTSTPNPIPTPTPFVCLQDRGRMETGSFRSDRLKLPMEYRIWLPPCYDQQLDRHFPVLYMIHGQNFNEDQWDRLGIDETAEMLIDTGEVPPFIIVMPRDRNWSQPEDDPFGDVLVEELVPWVDTTYRTIPDRIHRAIGGLSRGAGWAVHLGLSRWDLFGAFGAHSLPVFWTDTPRIHKWLEAIPTGQTPRIYLDIGDHDRPQILESARWFEELLTQKGIPHVWHLFPGYHEEAYWESHLEQYLHWYAAPWGDKESGL